MIGSNMSIFESRKSLQPNVHAFHAHKYKCVCVYVCVYV